MKKHLRTLMAGALVIVPIAVTVWLISWIGALLAGWGENFLEWIRLSEKLHSSIAPHAGAVGVIIALVFVYFVGMLANVWLFRKLFNFVDSTLSSLPGIKTIYESVRDLMKLFGASDSGRLGYAAVYTPPDSKIKMLGIVTNEHPRGLPNGDNRVIVYLPLAYMIGGPIVYARPEDLQQIDMPVETALKLAATAFVGLGQEGADQSHNIVDKLKSLKKSGSSSDK